MPTLIWPYLARRVGPAPARVVTVWPFRARRLGSSGAVPAPAARCDPALFLLLGSGSPADASILGPCTLGDILAALKAALLAALGGTQRVHASLARDAFPSPGSGAIYLRPRSGPTTDHGVYQGAGRFCRLASATISVITIDNHARDQRDTDDFRLTDPSRGVYAVHQARNDLIDARFVVSADGVTQLSTEPLEWVDTLNPRPWGRDFAWDLTESVYKVSFLQLETTGLS